LIGVDFDQFQQIDGPRATEWRQHILTSVVKHFDVAIYETMREFAEGRFTPGSHDDDLGSDAIEMSYSGGRIDPYRSQIEALRGRIVRGEISIPCVPEDRIEQAAELGLPPDACVHSSIP
jgi:basic membrane lipoprotein Med (substrate-binding protein (PBP1-ABC) superfamily)